MAARCMLWLFISILSTLSAQAQCPDTVNHRQLRRLVLGSVAVYTVTQAGLYTLWYQHQSAQSFQFFNDNPQWQQVDKAGHAYSAFHLSRISTRALRSTGLSSKKSMLYGSLTGFMLMLPIEAMDGFSQAYGASVGDLAANAAGATLFSSQMLLWHQIRIHPKFSFHRTYFPVIRPELLGSSWYEEVIKDYNGQTYWWSFDLYSFHKPGTHFPKWLNIALGYGANNMVSARKYENEAFGIESNREYYLALDIDLSHYKKPSQTFINRLWNTFIIVTDLIHLPSPALSYCPSKGFSFHPLFF